MVHSHPSFLRRRLLRLTLYSAGMLGLSAGAALAEDGAKGVAIARAEIPDVIICDLLMPEHE